MADVHGSNIGAADAVRFDRTQNPGSKKLDLAQRLRQVRVDMDALVAGVTAASIKTALAGDAANLDCGTAAITNAGNITSSGAVACATVAASGGTAAFGVSVPGAQPSKIADPTDLASSIVAITAVIDALEAFGLSST